MFLNRIYRTTARLGLDINTSCLRWVEICSASHQQAMLIKDYGEIALAKECTDIPLGPQDAKLGAEFTRDLNDSELENPKEYSLYFEGFPTQNHLKVDVKSDAKVRILRSERYIAEALRLFTAKRSLYRTTIGIALPDSSVQKTTLTLDANLSSIQLGQIFKQTAVTLLNHPIKDLYYRYQVTGFAKKHSSQLNFLLVAVQKPLIKNLLTLLKTYHITPKLIDVESFAVARGQAILATQPIVLAKHLHSNDFNQQSEQLALSLGLATHPALKNIFL